MSALGKAPTEISGSGVAPVIELPMPDGSTIPVAVYETSILSPEMAAKHPELRTYRGRRLDDGSTTIAMDLTPQGFHAIVLSPAGTTMIDPVDGESSLSYRPAGSTGATSCAVDSTSRQSELKRNAGGSRQSSADVAVVDVAPPTTLTSLRIFRAAVVASASYSASQGGTEFAVTAAISSQMNRVNAIFERDASIRLQLVDTVVYTNPASQPFAADKEADSSAMATAAHQILTQRLGANYDVGHIFTGVGGGGIASLGGVCNSETKGVGSSLGIDNVSPIHWINLVAHEFGHQFNVNHTFNAQDVAGCKASSRNGGTAMEPGSGSTTMSYVGLCNAKDQIQDLQGTEDLVFHSYSLKEMVDFVTKGDAKASNSCGVPTLATKTNATPVVTGPGNFTIPAQTPFALDASATDADDEASKLTYSWEQIDVGGPNPPNDDDGARPLFRAYLPQPTGRRYFPSLRFVTGNSNVPPPTYTVPYGPPADGGVPAETKDFRTGELMPTTTRAMRFRVTVRDNRAADGTVGGGIGFADSIISVVGGAGPFRLTAPNGGQTLAAGAQTNVTWDVAKTNEAPINTSTVRILLSTDGGLSYNVVLADSVPNNGSATVTLPAGTSTTKGRIQVAASANVYFDISDADIIIN